jgi:hypothetical protein
MREHHTASYSRDRSPANAALDNLIRRKLRVSNPNDPNEVARALSDFYAMDRRSMELEAAGMPAMIAPVAPLRPQAPSSSGTELDQAISNVERDLVALQTHSFMKDLMPEVNGWASAIRATIADGANAAKYALDPRQREKTFGARRLLGDYARISRYVGALTIPMSYYYRNLSQSLDEVSAVLLVIAGEAIANVGFSGGRFLLQYPASELQERRDAVINALRNFIGSTQQAFGPNDFPYGIVAYRAFLQRLEESGQSDLMALIEENNLARLMDDLVDRAAGPSIDGLRALGVTAQLAVESLRRILIFGQRLDQDKTIPMSPPFMAFLSAVQLFVDAFSSSITPAGYRMIYIARPPIVTYGLYGISAPDPPSRRLLQLTIDRGRLADQLDCLMRCECDDRIVKCQIKLDKILYDVDRAIDLYALSPNTADNGVPELRAAAYGYLIHQVLTDSSISRCLDLLTDCLDAEGTPKILTDILNQLLYQSNGTAGTYPPNLPEASDYGGRASDVMLNELCIQQDAEKRWDSLLQTMAPDCVKSGMPSDITIKMITGAINSMKTTKCPTAMVDVIIPPTAEQSLQSISEWGHVAARFNWTQTPAAGTGGVSPFSVSFTDQSIGLITSWSWTCSPPFPTGTNANQRNVTVTLNTGVYTVTLTVTGPSGSDNFMLLVGVSP